MSQTTAPNGRLLGLFALSMISVSAIIALRNLPTLAKNGFSIVLILIVAAFLFFIPIALVCAELASGWAKTGGLYAWVKEAFGERAGALAVWLEWIESVVWLPAVLTFIGSSIAFVVQPELADNRYFMMSVMLVILWGGTFVNFLSTTTSGWISTVGILAGSILPGIAIIGLGAYWLTTGEMVHIQMNWQTFFPSFDLSSLSYFTAIALGFAGIEVAAFYVQDTENPKSTFPRATFIAALIIISIYILGALAIAVVIPANDLSLGAGMMQAMTAFFNYLEIPWAIPVFAALSVIGALALLNTWIIGPSKGLHAGAMHEDFPKFMRYLNKNKSPVAILLMQATVGSLLIFSNLFIPSMNHFYWIFQIQAAQLILLMYLMIFFSVIKLRYSQPDVPRLYKIPGGKPGVWLIAGTGSLFCIFAFLVGFIPPEEFRFMDEKSYALVLFVGILLFCAPPFIWHYWQQHKK